MSKERRGAFPFLDTEWRRSVWQRWLGNVFLPPAPPHPPEQPQQATAPEPSEPEPRRQRRARLDALLAKLNGIEDALEALNNRVGSRLAQERRSEDSTGAWLESLADATERQASAIEELVRSMERTDERLERLERALARQAERPSRQPPRKSSPPEGAVVGSWGAADLDVGNGASMHGSLSDISLSTVMAMLELERRTGRLRVSAEEGSLACFELREGAVTASRINESDLDSVECMRQVLEWRNGRFWFRQNSVDDSPRGLGSLLLEATRQNDEARAEAR